MEIPTSDHDEALAGDTLLSVSFNFEWRRIIANALDQYLNRVAATITAETERQTFEGRVADLLEDFYS